jgi:hypothetical protein
MRRPVGDALTQVWNFVCHAPKCGCPGPACAGAWQT